MSGPGGAPTSPRPFTLLVHSTLGQSSQRYEPHMSSCARAIGRAARNRCSTAVATGDRKEPQACHCGSPACSVACATAVFEPWSEAGPSIACKIEDQHGKQSPRLPVTSSLSCAPKRLPWAYRSRIGLGELEIAERGDLDDAERDRALRGAARLVLAAQDRRVGPDRSDDLSPRSHRSRNARNSWARSAHSLSTRASPSHIRLFLPRTRSSISVPSRLGDPVLRFNGEKL